MTSRQEKKWLIFMNGQLLALAQDYLICKQFLIAHKDTHISFQWNTLIQHKSLSFIAVHYLHTCTHIIALIKLYTCAYWLQAIETALCIRCARCIDYYSRLYVILTNVTCLLIAFMLSWIWIFVWSTVIFIDPYKNNKNNRHIILLYH